MSARRFTPRESHLLATQPGVYRFYNRQEKLIYVGKAKNIKKRVKSYFSDTKQHNLKTQKMVAETASIEFTIVNSEYEALLLENNLIKEGQPIYNILLKDGKTYPYICITKEPFPRVITTRKVSPQQGQYYGPFTDFKTMLRILELIKQLYHLRTCTYKLTEENIQKRRFKVCLEYHLGNCKGPCEGLQKDVDYQQEIDQVTHLLKGNLSAVKKTFGDYMQQAARMMEYEKAQTCKDKLQALAAYQSKSLVINPALGDLDVCGIVSDDEAAFASYLQVKNGAITFTQTVEIKKKLDESESDLLAIVVFNFREQYNGQAKEILTNLPLYVELKGITLTVPRIGDKKKLVGIALKNALFFKKERFLRKESLQERKSNALQTLQQALQLAKLPSHIECFDNSNLQGNSPVASMVCFKNGKPAKKEYRLFQIKTVTGPDDFASMHEVVHRRYKRLVEEDKSLPDLIVVDGGKGQLNATLQALESVNVQDQIAVISIAKRLEEIYCPKDPYPIYMSKQSAALKLLQRIRNEAHRFALTFHRNKQRKASIRSSLETIAGVGPQTINKLLQHFKSVKNIQKANTNALAGLIGNKKANLVKAHLGSSCSESASE